MKPFELSEEIQKKLARLAIANDTVDWSDDDQSEEYTDERALSTTFRLTLAS
jgi:hypothetical protein